MNFMKKYLDTLQDSKEELTRYVSEQIDEIKLPDAMPVQIPAHSFGRGVPTQKQLVYGLTGGLALTIVGLLVKFKIMWISGIILIAVLLYFMLRRNSISARPGNIPSIDFNELSNEIYGKLQIVNSYITEKWDKLLGIYKDNLKNDIQKLDIEQSCKDKIFELAMKRSVISFSMIEVLTDVTELCRKGNIKSYASYLMSVKQKYVSAIETAYLEQKLTYEKIDSMCE